MTIVRYGPWTLLNRLHGELDEAFRRPPASPAGHGAATRAAAPLPPVAVHEDADRYLVRADLPGVEPSDIEVTADQGVLTIRAERRAGQRAGAPAQERLAGTFARRFRLPDDADAAAISARSRHGVLELTIRKQPQPEPRRITVEAA